MPSTPRNIVRLASLLAFFFALSSAAQAQATRTWVSGVGDDANPCSRTAPCKTYAGAISKTAGGGEINAIDPAGFGAVTITKSITLDGGGTFASILQSVGGSSGVVINDANSAPNTIVVNLRNLSINGNNLGANGIRFLAGKELHVQNVVIENFTTHGIVANMGTAGQMWVSDSLIKNCGKTGVSVSSTAAPMIATLERLRVEKCNKGVEAGNNSRVTLRDSVVSISVTDGAGGGFGFHTSSATAEATLTNNQISFHPTGVQAAAGVTRLDGNTIYGNSTGVQATGAVRTWNNNRIDGNTNDVLGVTTPISPQFR